MVMLSELRTADELVLALARNGWTKAIKGSGFTGNPFGPFFTFTDTNDNPDWPYVHRCVQFDLYPQVLDHGTDLAFGCKVGAFGSLYRWQMIERYAGSGVDIDPATVELNHLAMGELLDQWQRSWELS